MRKLLTVAIAAVLLIPAASRAQVVLGARVGYAPAMGTAYKDATTREPAKMSDGLKAQIPVQVDGALKVTNELALGAYFSYGFGQLAGSFKANCSSVGLSCSASDRRLGLQVLYTLAGMSPQFVPWAGLGIGYEWGRIKASAGGQEATITYKGWEYLNLQAGGDVSLSPQFSVGPYVMLSVAQYSKAEAEGGGTSISGDIANQAVHEWLGFGIRGKFDL